jgi:hypothetical protein
MSDKMREQLGAYMDGELHGAALQAMRAHLESCADCSEELTSLRRLSETLRQVPLPETLPSAAQFRANLMRSLPSRPDQAAAPLKLSAWLVPAGLLFGLVFIEATSILDRLAWLSGRTDILGGVTLIPGQSPWFALVQAFIQNLVNLKALPALQLTSNIMAGLEQWFISPLFYQALVALVYLVGLGIWWSKRRSSQASNMVLES